MEDLPQRSAKAPPCGWTKRFPLLGRVSIEEGRKIAGPSCYQFCQYVSLVLQIRQTVPGLLEGLGHYATFELRRNLLDCFMPASRSL